jgi:hypothetical protein
MKTLRPVHHPSQPFHLPRHREATPYKAHETDFLRLGDQDILNCTTIRRNVSRLRRTVGTETII